jgi:hypothetical protein
MNEWVGMDYITYFTALALISPPTCAESALATFSHTDLDGLKSASEMQSRRSRRSESGVQVCGILRTWWTGLGEWMVGWVVG